MLTTCAQEGMNFFVDGHGYAGTIRTFDKPPLATHIEQIPEAALKDLKLYQGMPTMDCSMTLSAYDRDVMALFGIIEGSDVSVRLAGSHQTNYALHGHVTHITQTSDLAETPPDLILRLNLFVFHEYCGPHTIHMIDSRKRTFQYHPFKNDPARS